MDSWILWLILSGILAVVEMGTLTLVAGMLSIAALAAMAADLLGAGTGGTLAVFAAAGLGTIVVARPIAKRHLRQAPEMRTGVDALPGTDAVVIERVTGADGRIKLAGEIWSARSLGGLEFEPGDVVRVLHIEGATAVVG